MYFRSLRYARAQSQNRCDDVRQWFPGFQAALPARFWPGGRRPSKSWGSGRQEFLFQLQIRIPASEHHAELLIQGFHPRLQQQMGTTLGPLHLLALAEAFTDHLVDRGFDKTGADALPVPIPVIPENPTLLLSLTCPSYSRTLDQQLYAPANAL
jgi:hypothetical protein